MILLDGAMFASMLERCSDLFTGTADELFNMMTDSDILLSSWQGAASDEFRSSLSDECEGVIGCLHVLSRIIVRTEDTAVRIADLKRRIGDVLD